MLSPRKAHRHKRSTAISGDFDLSELAGGDISHSHYRSPSNSNNHQFNIGSPLRSGQALDVNPNFSFSNKTEGTPLYSPSKASQTPVTPYENYTSTFDEPSVRSPRSTRSSHQKFFLSDDTRIENDIPDALIDLDDIGKNKRNVTLGLDSDASSKLHKRTESAPEFFNFSPTKFHSQFIIEEEDDNVNGAMNPITNLGKEASGPHNRTIKHTHSKPSLQLLELQPAVNLNRIPSSNTLKLQDMNIDGKQKEKSPSSSIFQMDIENGSNSHSSLSTGQKSLPTRRGSMSPVKPMTLNYADITLKVGEAGPKVLREREKGKENLLASKKSETSKNHRRAKSFTFSFLSSSVDEDREKTSRSRGRFLHWMRRKRD